ncbi:MAG: hypothetical protein ABL962_05370 [Fimbriimonadaceae bacterium]
MNRRFEQLNRYIYAVRCWLPPKQKDAALELYEDLLSQIEDREAEYGRPLAEQEIAEILRRCGHPLIVASRYLPEEASPDTRSALRLLRRWASPMGVLLIAAGLAEATIGSWLMPLTFALTLSVAMFAFGFITSMKFWSRSSRPGFRTPVSPRFKENL